MKAVAIAKCVVPNAERNICDNDEVIEVIAEGMFQSGARLYQSFAN